MAIKIVVPDLGESVVEATVANWLKQEGDRVKAGEAIVSLETDKVDLDIPATQDGVLSRIEHGAGEDVQVGDVLAIIDEQDATATGNGAGATEAQEEAAKSAGGSERKPPAQNQQGSASVESHAAEGPEATQPGERVTPVAKRIAAEKGIDLAAVSGVGPGGRVTRRDVESYLEEQQESKRRAKVEPETLPSAKAIVSEPTSVSTSVPAALAGEGRGEERVRMSRRRRTIAERLVEAQHTAAMLTTFNELDMSAVMELRSRKRDEFKEQHGVSLGFMSFFVKAVIGGLKEFPRLNAALEGNDMVLRRYYDIGIAVGAEEGLVVPVLRNADRMSFATIEQVIKQVVDKSQQGTLSIADLRGGTFTITNGGVFGSLLSTPILNPPQVGILGLHKIEQRPVIVKGEIVARPMMYVALSYDHRIVDGREAVQFLVKVKQLIEDPEELLLAG